jgi:hypothetical protein
MDPTFEDVLVYQYNNEKVDNMFLTYVMRTATFL